jgi:hypothetical protein
MKFLRRMIALRRLKVSMRPDPDYRENRLRQFSPERRERYFANIQFITEGK